MAVARAQIFAFAIQVLKATTAVTSRCVTTIAAAMERVLRATTVFVIRTGQGIDAILRHATTFKDVQVSAIYAPSTTDNKLLLLL